MNLLLAVIVFFLGILSIAMPETMAMFGERWKYKNAEPSEANVLLTRVGGVFSIIIAFFIAFSS